MDRRRAPQLSKRGRFPRPPGWLTLVLVSTGVLALSAALYGALSYAPARRRDNLHAWQERLTALVQNRRAALEAWVSSYLGDAQTLATFPSVRQVLPPGSPAGSRAAAHVREVFEQVAANKAFDAVWLLDQLGRPVIHVGAHDPERAAGPVGRFARQLAAGGNSVEAVLAADGVPVVLLGSPVWRNGQLAGLAVIQMDAEKQLFQVLGTDPGPTRTGEVLLVTRVGDAVVYLTRSRFTPAVPPLARRLALTPGLAAGVALTHDSASGRFRDYRGQEVIAATVRLRNAPWAIVAQVDAAETAEIPRAAMFRYVAASASIVALIACTLLLLGLLHSRRIERERRGSEARLRQLAENAGDIIYRYRLKPRPACEYINPAVTRITGFTPEECYADPFLPRKRVHPADAGHFAQLVAAPRTGDPAAFRWLHRDGSERMLELLNIPVRDETGEVSAIEGVARDVTQVYEQEAALRRSEERHRTLFENLAQGIVYFDRERERFTLNAAAEEILGLSAAQLQRLGAGALSGYEEDGTPLSVATLPSSVALESGETVPHRVLRLRNHRDGGYRWVLIGSRPLLHPDNAHVIAVYTTLTDITAMREAEAELRDTRELFRQAQKMEAVGRLAGGIAHDFNNLITAIKGYAALLAQDLPEGSAGKRDAGEIGRAADRAAALTRQLLAFSRKQVLELRVVHLDAVVRELEQMLRRVIGEDVTLVLEVQQELWPVLADSVQVEQVLLNLVVNSRDAIEWGGRIAIQLRNVIVPADAAGYELQPAPGEYVALSVVDTGSGMNAEQLQHIFEPFFTTKEVGRGTGLGLPTVYGIVQQSGGGIRVESSPGQGTSVEILLPRAAVLGTAPAPATYERRARAGGERILVVEDETAVRDLIRRMLESAGYLVDTAGSGSEALALASARTEGWDLLLTDVLMPGMTGSTLAREFRVRFPAVRVLYTSGYSEEFITRHGVLDPEADLLQKPFTQEILERAVRTALDQAQLVSPPHG